MVGEKSGLASLVPTLTVTPPLLWLERVGRYRMASQGRADSPCAGGQGPGVLASATLSIRCREALVGPGLASTGSSRCCLQPSRLSGQPRKALCSALHVVLCLPHTPAVIHSPGHVRG